MVLKTQASVKVVITACLFLPSFAIASCGDLPTHPNFLSKEYITQDELNKTTQEFDQFLVDVNTYQSCIDGATTNLDFDNSDTQAQTLRYSRISELLYKSQSVAVERHNEMLDNLEFGSLEIKEDASGDAKK